MNSFRKLEYTQHDLWTTPHSRGVGFFTDLRLYAEALALAQEYEGVTASLLQRQLVQRIQKMRLVLQQSEHAVEGLLRELRLYGWLQPRQGSVATAAHIVTPEGQKALELSRRDQWGFRRLLTSKMQEVYTIPGWFISRLWEINPSGQGEVILPAPPKSWSPASRNWDDTIWDQTLNTQTLEAAYQARSVSPTAFPIHDEDWLTAVRDAWERVSTLKPRRRDGQAELIPYSPRRRLAIAMREAGVGLLFRQVPYKSKKPDFLGGQPPVYPRTFMIWCPRLEALELLFYTDWHPSISGRLLFPTSAFRTTAPPEQFERLAEVKHPNGSALWLHQPKWSLMRGAFLTTLISVHQQHAARSGTLYVSLQDIRDEVCRQLRLSSLSFDDFLEKTLDELPSPDEYPWSVAIETDIREEQSGGAGPLRRPVYQEGIPHTLIALARLPEDRKATTRTIT